MKKHAPGAGRLKEQPQKGAAAFARKYPGFVAAAVATIIIAAIIVAMSFSGKGYSPTADQIGIAKTLYAENQQQLDDLIAAADEQLNGSYESTLEDDYFSSMKDDFRWLKEKETELYYARPAQDAYAREGAFTFFMQKILQINEDSAYSLESQDFNSTIGAAKMVSAPTISGFSSMEDFFRSGITEEDYNAMTDGNPYLEKRFLSTMNALIAEYYSAKALIIGGSSGEERKYVEAKKIMMLS